MSNWPSAVFFSTATQILPSYNMSTCPIVSQDIRFFISQQTVIPKGKSSCLFCYSGRFKVP